MKYLDLTFPSPAENLACDEALLDSCEEGADEILRFWQPQQTFVVVGYANKIASEVKLSRCRELNIPVLRRCTGGGTVLQGANCLNYSLLLKLHERPSTETITATNRFVMSAHRDALARLLNEPVEIQGHTDLAIRSLKFSGNSQRRKRHALLFHGTFLLGMDLRLIEDVLSMPSHEPDYRAHRSHDDFLMNLQMDAAQIKEALKNRWHAESALERIPLEAIKFLATHKYSDPKWNFRF